MEETLTRLIAFREKWAEGAVIDQTSGLTAEDLDYAVGVLRAYLSGPVNVVPGM